MKTLELTREEEALIFQKRREDKKREEAEKSLKKLEDVYFAGKNLSKEYGKKYWEDIDFAILLLQNLEHDHNHDEITEMWSSLLFMLGYEDLVSENLFKELEKEIITISTYLIKNVMVNGNDELVMLNGADFRVYYDHRNYEE